MNGIDPNLILFIAPYIAVLWLSLLIIVFFIIYRKKITVKFLRRENNQYKVVGEKTISPKDEKVRFEDKTFFLKPDYVSYLETGRFFNSYNPIIFIDYDTSKVLTFKGIKSKLSGEELDIFVSKNIIKQIVQRIISERLDLIILLIVFALGYMMGLFTYPYLPQPKGV